MNSIQEWWQGIDPVSRAFAAHFLAPGTIGFTIWLMCSVLKDAREKPTLGSLLLLITLGPTIGFFVLWFLGAIGLAMIAMNAGSTGQNVQGHFSLGLLLMTVLGYGLLISGVGYAVFLAGHHFLRRPTTPSTTGEVPAAEACATHSPRSPS